MSYDCPACGKKKSVKEYKTEEFSKLDYANINIFSEDPTHSLDILYLLPPWRCESCQSVMLRGRGDKLVKKTDFKCRFCKKGKFAQFENAAVGDGEKLSNDNPAPLLYKSLLSCDVRVLFHNPMSPILT